MCSVVASLCTQSIGTEDEALIENVFSKTTEEMGQTAFANALNNFRNKIPTAAYPAGVSLHTWVTQEDGLVTLQAGASTPIEGDILTIDSEADLRALAAQVTACDDYSGKVVILTKNIALSSDEWTPIGTMSNTFKGTFEGNGYEISGLRIGSADAYSEFNTAGLFGGLGANDIIRNLGLRDVAIYGTYSGASITGALVGTSSGIIENCYQTGDAAANSLSYNLSQFVGQNSGVIKSSYWNSDAAQTVSGEPVAEMLAVESNDGSIEKLVDMPIGAMQDEYFAKRLNSNVSFADTSFSLSAWGVAAGLNNGLPVLSGVGNSGVSSAGNLLTAQISAANLVYLDESRELSYTLALDGVIRANMFDVYATFNTDVLKYEGSSSSEVDIVEDEVPLADTPQAGLSDIYAHWAYDYILRAVELGFVDGMPDGTFLPDAQVTRAQFVKMIVTAFGLTADNPQNFRDTQDHWAAEYKVILLTIEALAL